MVTARGATLVCVLGVGVALATVAGGGFATATTGEVSTVSSASSEPSASVLPETTANVPSSTNQLFVSTTLVGQQSVQADTDDDAENETPRHQNPDEYEGSGDQDGLRQWLGDQLADRLAGSTVALSDGQYDLARSYLDDEYRDLAGQYVEVADEEDDEPNGFETAQDEQTELIDTLEEYDAVKEAYEEAQAAGNDREARQHARRLLELGDEIESLAEDLDDQHADLEEETDGNLSESRDGLATVTQDVQADRTEIQSEQFVETTLELSSADETISFLDPLNATGELRTVNGSPVANEPLRIEVGNQTVRTETDSDGTFDFEYRPTALPLETTALTIEAVPTNGSVYLESEAAIDVSVEQIEPTISELTTTEFGAYDETVTLEGTISAESVPVDTVPVAVSIAGQQLGTIQAENGSFEGEFLLPRAVPAGDHDLEVTLAFEERALAPVGETTEITIRETDTTISMDATAEDDDAVHVTGTLETADGAALENETVTVTLDGTSAGIIETDADGHFDETLESVPTTDGQRTLSVTYDDPGSNLASSSAETTVGTAATSSDSSVSVPVWVWGGLGLAAVIAGGWWYRERRSGSNRSLEEFAPTSTQRQRPPTDSRLVSTMLSQARDALADGRTDDAMQFSYGAVRRTIDPTLEARDRTHWEFFEQVSSESAFDADDVSLLYDLTVGYERSTFDTEPIERDRAESLFVLAARLCNRLSSKTNGTDGKDTESRS